MEKIRRMLLTTTLKEIARFWIYLHIINKDNVGRVFNKAGKIFAGPVTMVEIDSKHLPSDETMVAVCKRTKEFFENT